MFAWPDTLVAEIAERRCAVFIGAGMSHFCFGKDGKTKPPLWPDFLQHLRSKMRTPAEQTTADHLIKERRFLEAAEIMKADVLDAEYNDFLWQEFKTPEFAHAKVHEHIRDLDTKIVITTNFDTIYEDCCRRGPAQASYNVVRYSDDHLLDELKSTRRLIVKVHGCVTQQQKTVLARSQYFTARRDFPGFFSVLDAIASTNTLLFLGYGLGDPDIQLVLENVAIRASTACPHYAVTEAGQHLALKRATRLAFNVEFLEHAAGQLLEVEQALGDLVGKVTLYRSMHP